MKNALATCLVFSAVALGACASKPDFENAARVVAYGDGDRSGTTIDEPLDAETLRHGLIYEFRAGDIIRALFELDSDIAELVQSAPMDIRLNRDVWLYINKSGWWASLDGEKFERYDDLINGSLNASLATTKATQSNELKVHLLVDLK